MTGPDLRYIRDLTLGISGRRLEIAMGMDSLGRTVYRWESGEYPIPGPVATLMKLVSEVPEARAWLLARVPPDRRFRNCPKMGVNKKEE